eukprot:677823-Pyramimonas_sp.AAC.1
MPDTAPTTTQASRRNGGHPTTSREMSRTRPARFKLPEHSNKEVTRQFCFDSLDRPKFPKEGSPPERKVGE